MAVIHSQSGFEHNLNQNQPNLEDNESPQSSDGLAEGLEEALGRSDSADDRRNLANLAKPHSAGVLTLVGCVFVYFCLGIFYLPSSTGIYLVSYFQQWQPHLSINDAVIVFPFLGIIASVIMPGSMVVASKVGLKLTVLLCFLILTGSFFFTSLVKNFWFFLAIYSVCGIGNGIIYPLPVWVAQKHYPRHKGKVAGIITCSIGLGSSALIFIAMLIVNPHNVKATLTGKDGDTQNIYFDPSDPEQKEVFERVPLMMQVMAAILLVSGVAAALLIQAPREKAHLSITDDDEGLTRRILNRQNTEMLPMSVIFKSRSYWILFMLSGLTVLPVLYLSYVYKSYGMKKDFDDQFLTIVGSVSSLAKTASTFGWSSLLDYFSIKKVYFAMLTSIVVFTLTLDLVAESEACFMIWICVLMSVEGAIFSTLPTICAKIFGTDNGPRVYGMVSWGIAVANLFQFFLNKFALESLGYTGILQLMGGLSMISYIFLFFFSEKGKPVPAKYLTNSMHENYSSDSTQSGV